MKNKTLFRISIIQLTILLLFLVLTLGNEIIDIPHHIFNDTPTSFTQRLGEIYIELSIYFIVMIMQIWLLRSLYKRIRLLEGFISTGVCTWLKSPTASRCVRNWIATCSKSGQRQRLRRYSFAATALCGWVYATCTGGKCIPQYINLC